MEKNLYFLGLQPPDHVATIVTRLKEDFRVRYGCRQALKVPPHVTLVPPFRTDAEIIALRKEMPGFAAGCEVVDLHLQGFGYFAHARNRVIYLNVVPTEALHMIRQKLLSLVGTMFPGAATENTRDFHPHMTLAHRDLTAAAFHLAWPEYREQEFEALCAVDTITLFAHDGQCWQVNATYRLGRKV